MTKPRTRGSGEGTIFKRKDGRFCAKLQTGTKPDGKPNLWVAYGKTRREAADKLAAKIAEVKAGDAVGVSRQLVRDYLGEWLAASTRIAPRTRDSYEERIRLDIVPSIGHLSLDRLTPQHVAAMLADATARGLSPTTVAYDRAVLRTALNRALKWGLVKRNVAALVDVPRVEWAPVEPYSPVQARMILAALEGHHLEAVFTAALSIGLRVGEALGLRWSDVDLARGELRTLVQLQREGKNPIALVPLKSHQSHATIPLPAMLVKAFERRRTIQLEEQKRAGPRWQGNTFNLVFTSTVGTPLERHNLARSWRRILETAGIPYKRPHDLRHSCASLLIEQGVELRQIQDLLRHSQISITANLYTHLSHKVRRATADAMERALTPDTDVTPAPLSRDVQAS